MKKTLLLLAIAITQCLTISAGYEAQTISWNLKNATSGGIGETLRSQQLNGIDSTKNGVDYSIAAQFEHNVATTGVYLYSCHSTKNEFIKIHIPAGVKGSFQVHYYTGSGTNTYAFYYFIQPDTCSDPQLYPSSGPLGTKYHEITTTYTDFTIGANNIDLRDSTCSCNLYLYTVGNGGRYASVTWTETAVAPSAKWDFEADSTVTRANVRWLNKNNTTSLSIQNTSLSYYQGYLSGLTLEKYNPKGPWWNNSGSKDGTEDNKNDNAFELTIPGLSVGNIALTMTSTAKGSGPTAVYRFFVSVRDANTEHITMYNDTNNAAIIYKKTWTGSASTPSTLTIPINLLGKNNRQTISIIFLQNGGSAGGLRLRKLEYTYNTPSQGLTISENDAEHITKPISTSTPLKANIQRSTLSSTNYNTICLPFSMDAGQIEDAFGENCELYTLSSKSTEGGVITLNFTSASTITEGIPYLIKPASDINWSTPLYGTTIGSDEPSNTAVTGVTFYGAYTPTEIQTTDYFLGTNDLLYHPIPTDRTIKGLRGYFRITNPSGAPVRCAFNQTDTPTNLENQFTDSPIHRFTKIIKDGQLLIEHNNTYIDLMGRTIK